jgi:hypothetical protein
MHAMNRRHLLATLAAAPAGLLLAGPALAERPAISAPGGIAIRGADPVAYFTEGRYTPGRPEHALLWRGAVWHFDREETMAEFERNPNAYSPQFGGYCAYAMSHGIISQGDPRIFLVDRGALYLCNSTFAMARFRRDVPGRLAAALLNWPAVLGG